MLYRRYSVCVRQEESFCCVQYKVCEDEMGPLKNGFVATKTSGFSFDTNRADVSMADDNCVSYLNSFDYISIPESGKLHVTPK